MWTIIITIVIFLAGIFIGISWGIQKVTTHLISNNRLTENEAKYYYSLRNLIKI